MNNSRKARAITLFNNKYNCTQAIMLAYCDLVGLSEKEAQKISEGYGGGIAKMGKMCGTLNAGIMLISMRYSDTDIKNKDAKEKVRETIRNFLTEFDKNHKGLNCIDLLTEEEGTKYLMHSDKCLKIVSEVCDMLDKYLYL